MGDGQKKTCSCGAEIVMLMGPNGKVIPAQPVRTIYCENQSLPGMPGTRGLVVLRVGSHYVNHFETCPNRTRYRKESRP